jgi:hypothetical protein
MMSWLNSLRDWAGGALFQAATQLVPVAVPKVKAKQQSVPSYLRTAQPGDSVLPQTDRRLASTDIETYRTGVNTRAVIRNFAAASPDLSASLNAYLRTAITSFTAVARNMDGTFNRDATGLLQQLLTRFDVVQDYLDGFSGILSMRSISESWGKELMLYGSCAGELVLGKDRLPRQVQPVSTTSVQFRVDKSTKWLAPFQLVGGEEIDLDIATFFYVALDQDLLEPYSASPLEPAIQPVLASTEFLNDLRRVVKRAIHPRLGVTIDEEKFRKFIPPEIATDETKLRAYMTAMVADLESKINGLKPEEALVFFDTLGIEYFNNGNISLGKEYAVLEGILDAKVSTGAKAFPSILGHGTGSQNMASAETLLFMKNAEGSVQKKLNEMWSRVLTLAVRLFGQDVYVDFKYDSIDLRPDSELEAYKAMRQERTLALLSLGFISDDEASLTLTGSMTPAGFKPLSGTGFHEPAPVEAGGNPNSQTSTMNKNKKKGAPQAPKGGQKAEGETLELIADEVPAVVINNIIPESVKAVDVQTIVTKAVAELASHAGFLAQELNEIHGDKLEKFGARVDKLADAVAAIHRETSQQ